MDNSTRAPKPSGRSSSAEELRASLREVAVGCPVAEPNPVDCPLFLLRKMKPRQRFRWIGSLEEADLEYLADYHRICMKVRLASRPAGS